MNYKLYYLLLPVILLFIFTGCYTQPENNNSGLSKEEAMDKTERALTIFAGKFKSLSISDKNAVYDMITAYLNDNDYIYGSAFAFVPVNIGGNFIDK